MQTRFASVSEPLAALRRIKHERKGVEKREPVRKSKYEWMVSWTRVVAQGREKWIVQGSVMKVEATGFNSLSGAWGWRVGSRKDRNKGSCLSCWPGDLGTFIYQDGQGYEKQS